MHPIQYSDIIFLAHKNHIFFYLHTSHHTDNIEIILLALQVRSKYIELNKRCLLSPLLARAVVPVGVPGLQECSLGILTDLVELNKSLNRSSQSLY